MKKAMLGLILVWVSVMVTGVQGATYTYDAGVSDWYAAGGFTVAGNSTQIDTKSTFHEVDYCNQVFSCGAGDGGPFWLSQDQWAGAQWQAPAGEVVTQVVFSGYYRSETHIEGSGLFGGNASWAQTNYYTSPFNWEQTQVFYGPVTVAIPKADQVNRLQFRALWQIGGGNGFAYGYPYNLMDQGGYNGQITSVQITTSVIPQENLFVYDSTVANWYTSDGFTTAGNSTQIDTKTADYHGTNYQNMIYACGAGDGGPFWLSQDQWAGAEWTAPAGKRITQVIINGQYRSDTHIEGYGVFGGRTTAGDKNYYTSPFNWEQYVLGYGPLTVNFPLEDRVTKLQLRSLWQIGGGTGYAYGYPYNLTGDYNGKITSVQIATAPEPPTSQNLAFTVPAIKRVNVDGDLSDWTASTDWSAPYIFWNKNQDTPAYLTSTTQAKFAWNDATDTLYVAIRTNEASRQPGGHSVIGLSKNIRGIPTSGLGATQLCFDTMSGNQVDIRNEINYYTTNYSSLGWPEAVTDGVQAGYSYNVADGFYTYEIAIPLWQDWRKNQPKVKESLSAGDAVYLYSVIEQKIESANGNDLTWFGNPPFYNGAFNKAAVLTLAGPVAVPGDANGDNKVDVSDLGILAANYGLTGGATWETGDFNNDGKVDVSDLGILAANYGNGTGSTLDFSADAKALGLAVDDPETGSSPKEALATSDLGCGSAGLPLVAGLFLALMGLGSLDAKP